VDTPEWLNTLDNTKRTSAILPLAAIQNATSFPIQWAGSDAHAGVLDYTIFVSEDGGPFTPFLSNTTDTAATFSGQPGKSYAFFSVARDRAGNVEDPHPAPDATTMVRANVPPLADAGSARTVRFGSLVTLDGRGSADPDNGPGPLSFAWTQAGGPQVTLNSAATATPTFTPTVAGSYTFNLVVNDGQDNSTPASVTITVPQRGDIDLDGDVDMNDLKLILAARNTPANGPNDLRDLNGDGKIDVLDARILSTLCTRPRCATQ
jgi:hypothetical protein